MNGVHKKEERITYGNAEGQKALSWLEDVIAEGVLFSGNRSLQEIGEKLKDGVYLCKLIKKWQPSLETEIEKPESEVNCRKNIQTFLDDCMLCGITSKDIFQVDDLYNGTNIEAVIKTIIAVMDKYLNKKCDVPRGHLDTPYPTNGKIFQY